MEGGDNDVVFEEGKFRVILNYSSDFGKGNTPEYINKGRRDGITNQLLFVTKENVIVKKKNRTRF